MSSMLEDCGSSFVLFLLLRRPQSHYRKLPEYSVVLIGLEKHRARAPKVGSLREICSLAKSALVFMAHGQNKKGRGGQGTEPPLKPQWVNAVFCEDFHYQPESCPPPARCTAQAHWWGTCTLWSTTCPTRNCFLINSPFILNQGLGELSYKNSN